MITRVTKATSHHIVQTRQASYCAVKKRKQNKQFLTFVSRITNTAWVSKILTRNENFISTERTNEMHIHGYSYQTKVKKMTKQKYLERKVKNDHHSIFSTVCFGQWQHNKSGACWGVCTCIGAYIIPLSSNATGKVQNKLQSTFRIKRIQNSVLW